MTCKKAQEFLAQKKIEVVEQVDARKVRMGGADAVKLAREVNEIWVAKGKKILHFDMAKDKPSGAELKKALLGPSGNLRAPTMRKGKTLFVGFNAEEFAQKF